LPGVGGFSGYEEHLGEDEDGVGDNGGPAWGFAAFQRRNARFLQHKIKAAFSLSLLSP
jgi:hypothetical protein